MTNHFLKMSLDELKIARDNRKVLLGSYKGKHESRIDVINQIQEEVSSLETLIDNYNEDDLTSEYRLLLSNEVQV